jgi:Tol biopolymer transport system component
VYARRAVFGIALALLTGCGAGSGNRDVSATRSAEASVRSPTSRPVDGATHKGAYTSLISVSRFGDTGDGDSFDPSLSADGRYVAFVSHTTDLVAGDTNGRDDIFVRDTKTGVTTRINVSPTGAQGNGIRLIPATASIDGDGRYVAFQTDDSNLVPGGASTCTVTEPGVQPCPEIYVRDRRSGTTRLVNVSDSGVRANGPSTSPVISSDGRYVVFLSSASNLVPGDTNNATDVFVADLNTSMLRRVSVSSTGAQADAASYSVAMSANGRYIAFTSAATTLAPGKPGTKVIGTFFRDLQTGKTQLIGIYGTPVQDDFGAVWMSPNGRYVEFDSIGVPDLLVRDMKTGTVESTKKLTGVAGSGLPLFDATGRYMAFGSTPIGPSSSNPGQVLVRDLATEKTQVASVSNTGGQSNGTGSGPDAISGDGRYVVFSSNSPNLAAEDVLPGTEIYLRGPLH